jgi:hypothetical protein
LPSPLCCETTSPGTRSNTSAGRSSDRSSSCDAATTPTLAALGDADEVEGGPDLRQVAERRVPWTTTLDASASCSVTSRVPGRSRRPSTPVT